MSSWQDEGVEILRILINDFSDTPNYTDEILEQTLLVAARYVVQEVNLSSNYSINFLAGSIIPEPEDILLNFMVLKAACLTNTWAFNSKAIMDGITAKCGPYAQMSVKSDAMLILGLLREGPCKTYDELVNQYNFGNADIIRGILSPFCSNQFIPNNGVGFSERN